MTYPLLSLGFLAVAAAVLAAGLAAAPDRSGLIRRWWAPAVMALGVVLVLTAVFDNLMIAAGIMTYAGPRISGMRLGLVPLEDFSYPVAALLLLPGLWLLLRRRGRRSGS
jgi:lycopene cyclase domain-containing protein